AVAARPVRRVIRKSTLPSSVQIEQVRARSQSAARTLSQNVAKAKSWEEPANVFLAQKLAKEHMEDLEASEDEDETTRRQDVLTKYKAAGKLVDEVMEFVVEKCIIGANTYTLCVAGDEELKRRAVGVFSKAKGEDGKKIPRGIAFPCTVSVNNMLCNHSPAQESHTVTLKGGDVVKVHMGVHVDGYPVSAARTIIVARPAEVETGLPSSVCNTVEASRVALLSVIHMLDSYAAPGCGERRHHRLHCSRRLPLRRGGGGGCPLYSYEAVGDRLP
ncbi:peptidase, putative, partial [Bodo saltans]